MPTGDYHFIKLQRLHRAPEHYSTHDCKMDLDEKVVRLQLYVYRMAVRVQSLKLQIPERRSRLEMK